MRVYTYTILLLLILKSRALTTSTRRIERDVKKIRDYATVFRDSGSEVKFPGLSRKIREGWQVCQVVFRLFSRHISRNAVVSAKSPRYFSCPYSTGSFSPITCLLPSTLWKPSKCYTMVITLHGDKSPLDSSLQHKLETRPVSAVIPSSVL